ncbi:hypothetical protein [Paraburkholderia phenoliruptrix]|uniref:hypothetical protein n=1 Tax=Paraburkholderia phenoliruptrix TaxID=252970 RepID=UPI001C6F08AC|nr:hypothetical protein [Paraburkholderia phenoliruptrix]MBW9105817.1 hypothetical protein [Paraburkholderia phenoliruptrix]MBW9132975.1 hypothetical protein [Paraburkholderia ginsengiterrae]
MREEKDMNEVLVPLKVEVAQKSKVSVDIVERIFEQIGVSEEFETRYAEHLTIKRLMFTGEKRAAELKNGPFRFEWSDLETGLWLILSDGVNQIGKSSIIEVMIWALRGKTRQVRPEVRSWIDAVELDFSIGVDSYRVHFVDKDDIPVGRLLRVAPGPTQVVATFASEDQFEQVMDALMMRRFTLQAIPYVNRRAEVAEQVHHNWTLYAGSMFIEGSHAAILGDVAIGGLWWRMLTLFIGMPYSGPYMVLKSAKALADLRYQQGRKGEAGDDSRQSEISALRERIEELEAQISASSATMPRAGDTREVFSAYTQKAIACSILEQEYEELRHQLTIADTHLNESRSALRRLNEGSSAQRFFSGLNPVCCPRCAQPFSSKRLDLEQAGGNCAVCDRNTSDDDAEALAAAIADAQEQIDAAAQAKLELAVRDAQMQAGIRTAKAELNQLADDFKVIENMADDLEALQNWRLELERTRGAYEQLLKFGPTDDRPVPDADLDELRRILNIAERIAEKRARDGGEALLGQFESKLVEVATRIGFRGLERVEIRGNGIKLRVSGVDSNFSDQTPGQRLRLRIALVIAMMKLARISGKGNHPGLLLIDSPGAEELSPADLTAMMTEISALCDETSNLQIFVSSARGATFQNTVRTVRQLWGTATEPIF